MGTLPRALLDEAGTLLARFGAENLKLAIAESCTGGLIAAVLTELAGASHVFERGFVTYSNEAKTELLGVAADLIASHGAVSAEVAGAMAQGAVDRSHADIAVAVTGVAGPGGGSAEKPVGLVFVAGVRRGAATHVERHVFPGDREQIRVATVRAALALALSLAET
ncbi:MAG: CinA family protein [Alphaproteobacteria bacterium]|nr:CinA family protein [Alphaproteobacteria bacterium]